MCTVQLDAEALKYSGEMAFLHTTLTHTQARQWSAQQKEERKRLEMKFMWIMDQDICIGQHYIYMRINLPYLPGITVWEKLTLHLGSVCACVCVC